QGWFAEGSTFIQFVLFIVALVGVWLLLKLKKVTDVVIVVVGFLIGNTAISLVNSSQPVNFAIVTDSLIGDATSSLTPQVKPNIYLLIYDSYVSNEIML